MKKILIMLLALTCAMSCVVALASCGNNAHTCADANGDGKCDNCGNAVQPAPKPDEPCTECVDSDLNGKCDKCNKDVEIPEPDYRPDFVAAMNATKPEVLVVKVVTESAFGALTSEYTTTYAADGSFVINSKVEKFNLDINSGDEKVVTEAEITCDANGEYSDGGSFVGSNPAATGVKVDLEKLAVYTIEGDLLSATVAKADTKAVFGVAYEGDVTLVVTKNNGKIVAVALTYTAQDNVVKIVCEYR
jgi:hypothetical protein